MLLPPARRAAACSCAPLSTVPTAAVRLTPVCCCCFLRPESYSRVCWDFLQVWMLVFVMVTVPYRIGFNAGAPAAYSCDPYSWLTAAILMDNPCCSCRLTRGKVEPRLTAAVSMAKPCCSCKLKHLPSADTVVWSGWFWLTVVVDLYFIADIAVNFRTAIYGQYNVLEVRPAKIARIYLRGWCVLAYSCSPYGQPLLQL